MNSKGPGTLSREAANALLNETIARAMDINTKPSPFPGVITCIVVFGSYLSDKVELESLNVGVGVAINADAPGPAAGFEKVSPILLAGFHRRQLLALFRQPQNKRLSVHSFDEVLRLGTPYRVVFGTPNVCFQSSP